MADYRIEAQHLGFDVTVYPHNGAVHVLITDPHSGKPINMMVLPPGNAEALGNELRIAANIARRQADPHHDCDHEAALQREGFAMTADAPEVLMPPLAALRDPEGHE